MASSSRPFESQTISRLLAGYRRLHHGAKTLFLKGRLALVWGVQIAVFPAYVAFQGIRTGYRRLQQQHPWQAFKRSLTGESEPVIPMTGDTPIQALLSVIQPQITHQSDWRRPVNYYGAYLRQSRAGRVLTNGGWHLVPLKEPIRGIASDLATRELVLVTAENSIFAGLTEDQQLRLQRAIALLLAEYAVVLKYRQRDHHLSHAGLPLPKTDSSQWLVIRWLSQGMRWMQTSGLAAVTNLFGEAQQIEQRRFLREKREPLEPMSLLETARTLSPEESEGLSPTVYVSPDIVSTKSRDNGPVPQEVHSSATVNGNFLTKSGASIEPHTIDRGQVDWASELDVVEVPVSEADYIDHAFVRLLRWIDRGLSWLEKTVRHGWTWLRQYF